MIRLAKELGPNSGEPSREQDLRNYLGTFNFSGDMVKQAVGTMSGGEKARLVLAMIVWQRPNLLLLDEPTNHLDLATREALSMALNEFEGTVMLVSHDRALLRAVCDEFWMVGRGKVEPFDGDLDDYQHYLLEESKRLREEAKAGAAAAAKPTEAMAVPVAPPPVKTAAPAASTAPSLSAGEQRKQDAQRRQQMAAQTRPLKKELDSIDQRMPKIEMEKSELEAQLSRPLPAAEIADAGRRLKALSDEMATLEERWLELSEQLQALQA
jgi:ATP-binding cassette subfamily F protein 3